MRIDLSDKNSSYSIHQIHQIRNIYLVKIIRSISDFINKLCNMLFKPNQNIGFHGCNPFSSEQ